MNKRVVVDVVANTKPFVASILKLQKLSEALNKKQTKSSINILKNVLKNAQINRKISDFAEKTRKSYKGIEDSSRRVSTNMAIISASLFSIYRVMQKGSKIAYSTGKEMLDVADTYSVSPKEAEKSRNLSVIFGGTGEEGQAVLGKMLFNRMLFEKEQTGEFKSAAGRMDVDASVLKSSDLLELIKNLRKLKEERNLSGTDVQYTLYKMGLGNIAFLQRAVMQPEEEFNESLKKLEEQVKVTEEEFDKTRKTLSNFETILNNIKVTTTKLFGEFLDKPSDWVLKNTSPTTQTIGAGIIGTGFSLAGLALLIKSIKSMFFSPNESKGFLNFSKSIQTTKALLNVRTILGTLGGVGGVFSAFLKRFPAAYVADVGSGLIGQGMAELLGQGAIGNIDPFERHKFYNEQLRNLERDKINNQVAPNVTINLNDFSYQGSSSPRVVGEGIANGFINSPEFNMLNRGV